MRRTRQDIEAELRRRIREGLYRPGSVLPPRRELARLLGTTQSTLQHACDHLAGQGYLDTRDRASTRIADRLPHSSRLALVFCSDPALLGNRFWGTVRRVGAAWQGATLAYYDLGGLRADSPGHLRLCADIADRSLAGLILVDLPQDLPESPLFAADLPRVCLGIYGPAEMARFRTSVVGFDHHAALAGILGRFRAAGRRRLAVLLPTVMTDDNPAAGWIAGLARQAGLELRPEWVQYLPPDAVGATCARQLVRLLCAGPAATRPDCLLVADDNHAPYATEGVVAAGLRVPGDLDLAVHANFPEPTRTAMPCLRYGPDVAGLLAAAIAEAARLAGGGRPRQLTLPDVVREP